MNIQYKDVSNTDTRMSDDAYARETALMAKYFRAEAAMRDAIAEVNRNSLFAKVEKDAFEDFAHDYLPDPDSWKQTIEEQYRG